MFKYFLVFFICVGAMVHGNARADWCHKTGGGIEPCASIPETWSNCGTAHDGSTIWCYQSGSAAKSASHGNNTTAILIAAGVGIAFIGVMWYFFGKAPSENNPGQVQLMTF